LVIVYIVAVFSWWLYAFVEYTEKEYKLEYNNLGLNAKVIQFEMLEYLGNNHKPDEQSVYQTYLAKKDEIELRHKQLNQFYKISTHLTVKDTSAGLHRLLSINVDSKEYKLIHKNFIKKQRAFYSEVIFFTILVISGVVWVFGKLESLLNLNKMQNNFLLSVTHEFKTPLTAIKLSAQTLQKRKIEESTREQLVEQMVNNSDRLNELLDNVLLATRIDGKSYQFDMKTVDLTSIIKKTAELQLFSPNFTGKFIFDEAEQLLMGDETSLKLVFSNIFQNAIKYAGADCEISVKYILIDNWLTVEVRDNGKGLNPKELRAIFKKFYRTGDENTRETKGTGLGLFLVKQILKSHKASIKAEQNEPRGATFKITFKQTKL
jgi:signal transduction histidine kinase